MPTRWRQRHGSKKRRRDQQGQGGEEGPRVREALPLGVINLDDLTPIHLDHEDWPMLPLPKQSHRIDRLRGCKKNGPVILYEVQ